jgi:hypothetical protein
MLGCAVRGMENRYRKPSRAHGSIYTRVLSPSRVAAV